jgi:hypothetical protein
VDGSAVLELREAVERTFAAETARIRHGSRCGGANGEVEPMAAGGEGWIDLAGRCAWLKAPASARFPGVESFWEGGVLFARFDRAEAWSQVPLVGMTSERAGAIPYSSPFWLLDALLGANARAEAVGNSRLDGEIVTHAHLQLDVASAQRASPYGLTVPDARLETFPAEVWTDELGRIRRADCTWPSARWTRPRPRWMRPRRDGWHWLTTELFDFGVAVDSPSRPGAT